MAGNSLSVTGLTRDVTNPYDPSNIDTDAPLGMKDVSGEFVGKGAVASLLPGEISSHYLAYDCHRRVKECDPKGDGYECVSCRSIGGGTCVRASAEIKREHNLSSDGVCIPVVDVTGQMGEPNPFTTVDEAYLQYEEGDTSVIASGSSGGVAYLTRKRGCINSEIVRKDPDVINRNPILEPVLGCTDIVMCGGSGVGLPIHPVSGDPIVTVDEIDFDINRMAYSMTCYCESGYMADRNEDTHLPICKRIDVGVEDGHGCPVVFYTGDTKGCLCDDSTQVRLEDITRIELVDDTTDYAQEYIQEAKNFMKITERFESINPHTTRDACFPKPGVDPRMASLGYSYATSLFGLAPEITAFNGGHLMTGGLLRESAMDGEGNWHSRIEDNEEGKVVLSESTGGVVPYAGTGSVAAHVWNGDRLNTNNLVGAGSSVFNSHPNSSMRVVPLPHSSLPGFGIDSMDHSVGIVASQGRVYPQHVFVRKGHPHLQDVDRRGAETPEEDTSFFKDSSRKGFDFYKESPLSLMRSTHDSGICATAYVVPSIHRVAKEKPDAKRDAVANKLLPLMHYRPLAKRAAHTPIETIFRNSILTAASRSMGNVAEIISALPIVNGDYDTLTQLLIDHHFPNLAGEGKERSGGISARSVFMLKGSEELREIGGLIIQPVTVQGDGISSTFARFGEKILSTNSPRIIDHYKVGPSAAKCIVDEDEARQLFATPPTAWRIATNEGNFFSGRGLNNGIEGTGMREAEKYTEEEKPDIFSAVIMSGDGVLMNGESAPLMRPLEIPACSLPECTWFERRGQVNARGSTGDYSNLSEVNNAYSSITAGGITAQLNANTDVAKGFNTYSPAKPYYRKYKSKLKSKNFWLKVVGTFAPIFGHISFDSMLAAVMVMEAKKTGTVGSLHKVTPSKFYIEDDMWQQCKVTSRDGPVFINPPMAMFESLLRVRTIASECFIRPELLPNRFRAEWGLSPHTAGHYLNGIYSPPCIREETGQAYGYPCSGALCQYITLMVPKPVGENSHSTYTKKSLKSFIDAQLAAIPQQPTTKNIFDKIGGMAKQEKCNCTNGLFCPKLHAGGRGKAAPITALPSRGNRHSRFALMTTMPKNDIHLLTALLRAQSGDTTILDVIGKTRQNGITESLKDASKQLWGFDVEAMVAPNRWSAFRCNVAYTPYSTRIYHRMANTVKQNLHHRTQPGLLRTATDMGVNDLANAINTLHLLEDSDELDRDPSEISNVIKTAAIPGDRGARSRRILDFLESSQGATPSTFNVCSFAPHAEGVKDIVAVYATPMYTGVSTPAAIINEGPGRTEAATIVSSSTNGVEDQRKRKLEEEDAEVFKVDKFGKPTENLRSLSRLQLSNFDISNPGRVDAVTLYEASKRTPRVMRRIHLMPINTPYLGGFECGQTPAAAACTRGIEFAYADFMKPPLAATAASTSLEGIRIKAPEPFDNLSTRGFLSLDSLSLRKFAHHHHYGYEGLMARNYSTRKRGVAVPEGVLKNRFPFVCQSDRGTFPPKRDGTIQPLALVDMGVLRESVVGSTILQE